MYSDLNGANVLVTGGAGFIGSTVVSQLYSKNCNVTVLDNFSSGKREYIEKFARIKIIDGDMTNAEILKTAIKNQHYIINLAALPFIPDSYYFPKEFFDVNVNGTLLLMMLVSKMKIKKLVHISSSEVYGTALHTPMDENHPTLPHSTYAVSKLAADRVVFTMHKEHGVPAVIIRPFNTYGPNITQPYIIPELASQLIFGNGKLKLGNIKSQRDLTYVEDTAKGIISALVAEDVEGETINLGSSNAISIEDIAKTMAKIVGKDNIEIERDSERLRPFDVDVLQCNNNKASKLLGWSPSIPLVKGLELTVKWIKENKVTFRGPFKGWSKSYREQLNQRNSNE